MKNRPQPIRPRKYRRVFTRLGTALEETASPYPLARIQRLWAARDKNLSGHSPAKPKPKPKPTLL